MSVAPYNMASCKCELTIMAMGRNNESHATDIIILVDLSFAPTGQIKLNITKRISML
jgi:hypothetical protein